MTVQTEILWCHRTCASGSHWVQTSTTNAVLDHCKEELGEIPLQCCERLISSKNDYFKLLQSGSKSYRIMGVIFHRIAKIPVKTLCHMIVCEYVWIYTYRASKLGKCFLISLKLQLRSHIKQFISDVESAGLTNKPGNRKTDLSVQVRNQKKKMHKRTRIQESTKH